MPILSSSGSKALLGVAPGSRDTSFGLLLGIGGGDEDLALLADDIGGCRGVPRVEPSSTAAVSSTKIVERCQLGA